MHKNSHPLAGETVKIKASAGELGGKEYRIEDWWDLLTGGSWEDTSGNPACMNYALHGQLAGLSVDDEVLYGKIGCLGYLVHVSEIKG